MAITLKQLAEYTELSIPTVSEILNNKPRLYRQETRQRVLEAAEQLGYRPNSSARSIKTGKFGAIGVLQSSLPRHSYLPVRLLEAMQSALNPHDLLLTLATIDEELVANSAFIPKILHTLAVDGLLINYVAGFPKRLLKLIHQHRIPSIWVNAKPGADCVHPDDFNAARMATEHFLKLGHRRIAFADYNFGYDAKVLHYSLADRYAGYVQAMQQAGLPLMDIIRWQYEIPQAEQPEFSRRWLAQPDRPTAVLAYTGEMAVPIVFAAKCMGLDVPGDLSVIGFADHVTQDIGFIDTVIVSQETMAQLAVKLLLQKIADPSQIFPPQAFPLTLHKGWSSAPPSSVTPTRWRPRPKAV